MKSIEDHIAKDKEILADPKTSEPMRHHIEDELHDLEEYVEHHKDEIKAGDHHDPNVLEVFCDIHPDDLSVWYMTTKKYGIVIII